MPVREIACLDEKGALLEVIRRESGTDVIPDNPGFSQRWSAPVRNEKRMRTTLRSVGLLGRLMLVASREIVVARLCRAGDQALRIGAYQRDNQNNDM